jgi:hypothetical protein
MAFPQIYCVEWLAGHTPSKRRGLAWLNPRPRIEGIDGESVFKKFNDAIRRNFEGRFDWWTNAPLGVTKKEYCQGWDEEGYGKVWVFKYREHRIFGFLCHPDDEDPSFQMCVLCSYTIKDGWEADKQLKDLMAEFAEDGVKTQAARNVHEKTDCEHAEGERDETTKTAATLDGEQS